MLTVLSLIAYDPVARYPILGAHVKLIFPLSQDFLSALVHRERLIVAFAALA